MTPTNRPLTTLRRWTASPIMRTLLLLLVLEGGLRIAFAERDHRRPDIRELYSSGRLQRAHPTMTMEEVVQLTDESIQPFEFEPFTGYRERPRSGRYVNVLPFGIRAGPSPVPWPPDTTALNVFVFGGSTTFGSGATDSDTIPSRLQLLLDRSRCAAPVHVYNFGRGAYYSSQEQVLFETLLRAGIRPAVAVFIDGTNDATVEQDQPEFSQETARIFEYNQSGMPVGAIVRSLAFRTGIGRLAAGTARRLAPPGVVPTRDPVVRAALGAQMVGRWLETKRMIEALAKSNGVRTIFVIQPNPYYHMDLATHPFRDWSDDLNFSSFYPELDRHRGEAQMREVVWLADIQLGRNGADLYIDSVHYTASFAAEIAESLAEPVRERLPGCGAGGGVGAVR